MLKNKCTLTMKLQRTVAFSRLLKQHLLDLTSSASVLIKTKLHAQADDIPLNFYTIINT